MTLVEPAPVEVLGRAEAEKLTAEIKAWAGTLWVKLRQAHDGQAWRSLGYPSWSEYVRVEFDMSRSRAYQLVSHARAVAELEVAAGIDVSTDVDSPGMSPIGDTLTEGATRDLDVPAAAEAVREAVADLPEDAPAADRAAIVGKAVAAHRPAPRPQPDPPPAPRPPAPTFRQPESGSQRDQDIAAAIERHARFLEKFTDAWHYFASYHEGTWRDEVRPHLAESTIDSLDRIEEYITQRASVAEPEPGNAS